MQQQFQPETFKYIAPDGQEVDVEEELWKWTAEYSDETSLEQFDKATCRFHKMDEIDQQKIKSLYITSSFYNNSYTIIFPPDNSIELVIRHYRRRHDVLGKKDTGWFTIFVFGYIDLETNKQQFLVLHGDEAMWTHDYKELIA